MDLWWNTALSGCTICEKVHRISKVAVVLEFLSPSRIAARRLGLTLLGVGCTLGATLGVAQEASRPAVGETMMVDPIPAGAGGRNEPTIGPFYRAQPPAADDDARPLSLTLRQGWRRNSNLYSLSPVAAQSLPALSGGDTVTLTGVKLGFDRRVSAQDFAAWLDLASSRYHRFGDLDNVAWSGGGRWSGELGRAWYASASVGAQRYLNPFANQTQTVRNLMSLNSMAASLGYRFAPRWSVYASADRATRRNGADSLRESDLDLTGFESGLRLESLSGDADASLVVRTSRGRFLLAQQYDGLGNALAQPIDNSYRDRSVLLRAALRPSSLTYLVGELGWTARRLDALSSRDVSGLTGSLLLRWQPTDPLRAELYLRRNLGSIQLGSANFVETTQFGALAAWQVSAKVMLSAMVGWDRYRYAGDPLVALGQALERLDRLRVLGVSATWQAWRNVALMADHRREARSSNYDVYRYDADVTSVFVQARFD